MKRVIKRTLSGQYHWPLSFALLALTAFLLLGTFAHAGAPDPQCKPDSIMGSGFEDGPSLLFEDTFEGCRSSLWGESDGDWQVASGAYYTTVFSSVNVLPLQPSDFIVELEVSDIQGGGLWLRLDNGTGVILQIGSTASDDFIYWQSMNANNLGPVLNPSANGVISPDSGEHTIKVIVESGTYQAFVDGKLATTLTHADIIAAGRTPPDNGAVGLQGQGTSTRFNRIRIWGENRSTAQIVFTTDQSILLESIGQSYQFSAQVVDSLGAVIPDIDLQWSLQANALVSMTASGGGSATVEVDSLGLDTLNLIVSAPSLQISNQAQIMLADLAPDAVYLDSNVVIDNGYGGGDVILHRNAKTELIQVGDVLVSGDEAGLLLRVLTVTLTADQVILTVEPAKITDAFRNLNIAGASQAQSLSVHFDAETNRVTVASLVAGDATTQNFVVDGLECKTEDQSDFGLDLSGGSIDWDIQEEVFATLSIEEYVVQEFSFYTTQSLSLDSATGSLTFSSTLAGTVTCEIPIDKIETPSVPLSVFSFGLGIQPIIGVRVSGTIDGPSFTIQGPSTSLQGSATEGIKYTLGGGWEPVGNLDWGGSTKPFSANFKHGVEFAMDAGAFGGIHFDLSAKLGRGKFLSYELATVEFAELNSDATLSTAFASPFDPLLKSYTGPNWDVTAYLESLYKAELTSGALMTLLERLDVPTTLPFSGEIFTPMEVDLVHSPVINLYRDCVPADCVLLPDEISHKATFTINTDDKEPGNVEFLASIDAANDLHSLALATLQAGLASVNWSPSQDDTLGRYEISARVETDTLSSVFPYASVTPVKLHVGEVPDILLADLEFPDPNLKACVLAQTSFGEQKVYTVADLVVLGCSQEGIFDLTGLEQLTHLERAYLAVNDISDISVLGTMTHLTLLKLSNNEITDVTALGSLTQLTRLDLYFNQGITDVSALVTLTELQDLNLRQDTNKIPCGQLNFFLYVEHYSYDGYYDADGNGSKNVPPDVSCGPILN